MARLRTFNCVSDALCYIIGDTNVKQIRLATSCEIRESLNKLAQMNFEQQKASDNNFDTNFDTLMQVKLVDRATSKNTQSKTQLHPYISNESYNMHAHKYSISRISNI